MDDREFFCKRHRAEFPTFMKVLEAMPLDQFAYRPHERSPSALDLVWTLANEVAACTTMIDSGEVHWGPPPAPLPREALSVFHANYEALHERVNRLGEEVWRRPSKLYVGGELYMEQPLGGFLWYLFFDAIHHRGQLSTYIRPMGARCHQFMDHQGMIPAIRAVLTGLGVSEGVRSIQWKNRSDRKALAPSVEAEPSQFDCTLQVANWPPGVGRLRSEAVFWLAAALLCVVSARGLNPPFGRSSGPRT